MMLIIPTKKKKETILVVKNAFRILDHSSFIYLEKPDLLS